MSNKPKSGTQRIWNCDFATEDILHILDPDGNVIAWIDGAGELWGGFTTASPLSPVTIASAPAVTDSVLTATSEVTAEWKLPGKGPVIATERVSFGTINTATVSNQVTVNWSPAFADNFYTVTAQVAIGEATSDGAVTSIINVASLQLLDNGAGVVVTIANADSINHTVTLHLIAIHD